jgi:hypothetical protein
MIKRSTYPIRFREFVAGGNKHEKDTEWTFELLSEPV